MNKTKKITQGAMMLAIVGALILIDRLIAYMFTELVVLIVPVVIIMYSTMNTVKDGVFLSIGLTIIAFLLGNFQMIYLIYVPVGIVTGIVYSICVAKGMDRRKILFMAMLTYIIGEIIATFIVYPLIGFPLNTLIAEYKATITETQSITGYNFQDVFKMIGADFDKLLVVIFIVSTIIMGAMEGILIHLLALFMLKRFKVKDLGRVNVWDIKPNPIVAYVCFLSTFIFFIKDVIKNETVYYCLLALAIIAMFILLYYGYIFIVLYGAVVLHRNIGVFYVILSMFIPVLLIAMLIMGFLYGAGPLRRFLEDKVNFIKNNTNQNE